MRTLKGSLEDTITQSLTNSLQGVSRGGFPAQEESPQLQTYRSKEDLLKMGSPAGLIYTHVEPDLWSYILSGLETSLN